MVHQINHTFPVRFMQGDVMIQEYIWIHYDTLGYRGIQDETGGYRGIQRDTGNTGGYGDTGGYRGIQGIQGGYYPLKSNKIGFLFVYNTI